jgi:hypothetical protein
LEACDGGEEGRLALARNVVGRIRKKGKLRMDWGKGQEQLAYLASGGREGTLLEEVEGLTSGEHDECLFFGRCGGLGGREEEGRKRKVGKKEERGKADREKGSTLGTIGSIG